MEHPLQAHQGGDPGGDPQHSSKNAAVDSKGRLFLHGLAWHPIASFWPLELNLTTMIFWGMDLLHGKSTVEFPILPILLAAMPHSGLPR